MQQINWGIIGCGSVTELKSGPAFNKIEGSRVMAVMRRDAEKVKDYARRHQIPSWYSGADDLISDPEVNAVYIATPPSSHAEYAIRVMEKGKIAYVEKPMASSYPDCLRMQQVSRSTGMPLYVAYYRRFLPYFIHVRKILESGQLGQLLYAKIDFHIPPRPEDYNAGKLPWRVLPEIAGAGYFYDLACHQIDLFDWFFGKVGEVRGNHFNRRGLYKAEDLVLAQIFYESGLPVTGSWCFASDDSQNTDVIRIYGTSATLEFSTFAFTPVKLISKAGISEELPPNPDNIQYWFIRNMVEELQGLRPRKDNCEAATRTNWIMDKILGRINS
jgi:predicted dehydrogenase